MGDSGKITLTLNDQKVDVDKSYLDQVPFFQKNWGLERKRNYTILGMDGLALPITAKVARGLQLALFYLNYDDCKENPDSCWNALVDWLSPSEAITLVQLMNYFGIEHNPVYQRVLTRIEEPITAAALENILETSPSNNQQTPWSGMNSSSLDKIICALLSVHTLFGKHELTEKLVNIIMYRLLSEFDMDEKNRVQRFAEFKEAYQQELIANCVGSTEKPHTRDESRMVEIIEGVDKIPNFRNLIMSLEAADKTDVLDGFADFTDWAHFVFKTRMSVPDYNGEHQERDVRLRFIPQFDAPHPGDIDVRILLVKPGNGITEEPVILERNDLLINTAEFNWRGSLEIEDPKDGIQVYAYFDELNPKHRMYASLDDLRKDLMSEGFEFYIVTRNPRMDPDIFQMVRDHVINGGVFTLRGQAPIQEPSVRPQATLDGLPSVRPKPTLDVLPSVQAPDWDELTRNQFLVSKYQHRQEAERMGRSLAEHHTREGQSQREFMKKRRLEDLETSSVPRRPAKTRKEQHTGRFKILTTTGSLGSHMKIEQSPDQVGTIEVLNVVRAPPKEKLLEFWQMLCSISRKIDLPLVKRIQVDISNLRSFYGSTLITELAQVGFVPNVDGTKLSYPIGPLLEAFQCQGW